MPTVMEQRPLVPDGTLRREDAKDNAKLKDFFERPPVMSTSIMRSGGGSAVRSDVGPLCALARTRANSHCCCKAAYRGTPQFEMCLGGHCCYTPGHEDTQRLQIPAQTHLLNRTTVCAVCWRVSFWLEQDAGDQWRFLRSARNLRPLGRGLSRYDARQDVHTRGTNQRAEGAP